jgi:hypothetical protein
MQKQKFGVTCPNAIFVDSVPVPPEHEKSCLDISLLGCTGMHYVTHRSQRMQKDNFGIMCPEALFVKPVPVPSTFRILDAPECTTLPANPSRCKKHKFGTTCPEAHFVKSVLVPPEHEK